MISRRHLLRLLGVGLGAGWALCTRRLHAGADSLAGAPDFSFIHLSDTHLDPRPAGAAYRHDGRSVGVLRWFAERAEAPITESGGLLAPDTTQHVDSTARPPQFAIHTGDVFEYSIVDDCWSDWGRSIEGVGLSVFCVPGNHDNTWGSINSVLRKQYGGDSYSFDREGCHFICLNSAGSLDPLPCWDERTLRWLESDLRKVPADRPVFLALHHPLSGNAGYASEYDKLRFWRLVHDRHVVMMFDGHWHQVRAGLWQNTPRVNGGETFRRNPGYATVRVSGGRVRQRYHFHDTAEGGQRETLVLDHPIDLRAPRFHGDLTAEAKKSGRRLAVGGRFTAEPAGLIDGSLSATAWVNGKRRAAAPLTIQAGEGGARVTGTLPTRRLPPGRHFVTVRVESLDQTVQIESEVGCPPQPVASEQVIEFEVTKPGPAVTRFHNPAGIKTPMLLCNAPDGDQMLLFGDTAGVVTAVGSERLEPRWRYETGSEVLHALSLARLGESTVVVGDADGRVHLVDPRDGRLVQRIDLGAPLYGAAIAVEGRLYMGDANGQLHAFDGESGREVWSVDAAEYAFETAPAYDSTTNRLLLGSWDGALYAIDRETGEVVWRAWSPTCEVDTKSRYNGPADCSALVFGDKLWAADRGYRLGRYRLVDGAFLGVVREQVSGIGAISLDGSTKAVIARGLDNRLTRLDTNGEVVWSVKTPLGRSPRAPVFAESVGALGVVSDTGLLSIVDADAGEQLGRHSLTPKLFVHSGLAYSDTSRSWYAAGMDGVVSKVPHPV